MMQVPMIDGHSVTCGAGSPLSRTARRAFHRSLLSVRIQGSDGHTALHSCCLPVFGSSSPLLGFGATVERKCVADHCERVSGCWIGLSRGQHDDRLFGLKMEYVFRTLEWLVKLVMTGRRLLYNVSPRGKSNGRLTLKYMTAGRFSNWHVRDLQSLSSRAQYFRACYFDRADEVVRTTRFSISRRVWYDYERLSASR